LPGRVNYLIGNDSSKYHRNVPIFGRVKMKNVYPGVDLVFYGTPQALEYDLIASPGAETSKLKFAVEGGSKTEVDARGSLVIRTAAGTVVLQKPRVYQQDASGAPIPIEGSFALAGDGAINAGIARREVTFKLAPYDHRRTLTIDPTIIPTVQFVYSTYLGGSGASTGPMNNSDLTNVPAIGDQRIADAGTDVALDPNDDAYVTGVAYSNDFPTSANPFQSTSAGVDSPPGQNPNAFVSKFDYSMQGAASLIYSTYLGGSGDPIPDNEGEGNGDIAYGIAVDSSGQAFVVGQTYSLDFPATSTCGAFGQLSDSDGDSVVGFVAKLTANGDDLIYACYIPGRDSVTESGISLFPASCGTNTCKAYISETTFSDVNSGFPVTQNAFQSVLNGTSAATLVVVHEDGQSLDCATLFGGSGGREVGAAVTVDTVGSGYITGSTLANDLPMVGAQVPTYNGAENGSSDAFVAEFAPGANGAASLVYSTYLGGSGVVPGGFFMQPFGDAATAITYDGDDGTIWVAGQTASTDFQVPGQASSVFQSSNLAAISAGPPATSIFLTELNPSIPGPQGILYSTYISGNGFAANNGGGTTFGFGDAPT
jgi:hypothetical protein